MRSPRLGAQQKAPTAIAHSTPAAKIVEAGVALRAAGLPMRMAVEVRGGKLGKCHLQGDNRAMSHIMKTLRHLRRARNINMLCWLAGRFADLSAAL